MRMVKCEICAYDDEGNELEGSGDIPHEPYVTVTPDGKEHYFCSHGCQRTFEIGIAKLKKVRVGEESALPEDEIEKRRNIIAGGKGSSYGTLEDTTQ